MLRNPKDMYIYHLPHTERTNLCRILDQNNQWEELGVTHMKFDRWTVQDLRKEIMRGHSPTDELLTMWGHQNHTVLELFVLLGRMKHYQAMMVIKDFVEEKYHRLIKRGPNLENLLGDLSLSDNATNANLDRGTVKTHGDKEINVVPPNAQDLVNQNYQSPVRNQEINTASRENNESVTPQKVQGPPRSPLLNLDKSLAAPDISSVASSASGIPQITYEALQQATDNWNPAVMLGKGGFGTVFKGTWKCTQVAIKRIENRENQPEGYNEQMRQSIRELFCLNAYRHDNILPLYGYSIGGPQPCLVYQYMSGGCLDKRLRIRDETKVLNWESRLNIATGTARGLQFLHTIGVKPLIHGDIKSANILLDGNDQPRIGDFGLAREGPESDYTRVTRIQGTKPYLPDEFLRAKKFSTKVDTYSFGIVLFEIGTSLAAYSDRRDGENKYLKQFIMGFERNLLELKDRRAPGGETTYIGLMEIGRLCVNNLPKNRPEMVSVLVQLERITN